MKWRGSSCAVTNVTLNPWTLSEDKLFFIVFQFTHGRLRVIRTTITSHNRNDYAHLRSLKPITRNRREEARRGHCQSCLFAFLTPGNASSPMHSMNMSKSDCATQTYFTNGKKHDQVKHLRLCISDWTRRLKSDEFYPHAQ